MLSFMCTGIRIVREWSAIARVTACRIHQVAYVENLYPRRYSNLSAARIRPILPSWIRSSRCSPRLTYFLATDTTSRRFASTRSCLARSASCSPWRITVSVCFNSSSDAAALTSRFLISRFSSRIRGCWAALVLAFQLRSARGPDGSTHPPRDRFRALNSRHLFAIHGTRRIASDVSTIARESFIRSFLRAFLLPAGAISSLA